MKRILLTAAAGLSLMLLGCKTLESGIRDIVKDELSKREEEKETK